MELKVKKLHKDAILPRKAHATDACFDLFAVELDVDEEWFYNTGIAIEIPEGYYGQILTRSGMAKVGIFVVGGVIDSGYRGEIKVFIQCPGLDGWLYDEKGKELQKYCKSQAVAQLAILPVPECEIVEVDELSQSDRGVNGFGSTDQKEA